MGDFPRVRGVERGRESRQDPLRGRERERAARQNNVVERPALDELIDEQRLALHVEHGQKRGDAGMFERGQKLRFLREARDVGRGGAFVALEPLDRHFAPIFLIEGQEARAALAEFGVDAETPREQRPRLHLDLRRFAAIAIAVDSAGVGRLRLRGGDRRDQKQRYDEADERRHENPDEHRQRRAGHRRGIGGERPPGRAETPERHEERRR